jgi:hypothetical protein
MSGILKQAKEVIGLREEFKVLAEKKEDKKNKEAKTTKVAPKAELAEAL